MSILSFSCAKGPFSTYVSELASLDHAYFPYWWDLKAWKDLEQSPCYSLSLYLQDEQIQAFCLTSLNADQLHLIKILVVPKMRGQGLSKSLFLHDFNKSEAANCYLEVNAYNVVAISLYETLGFSIVHRVDGYYSDGGEALKMLLIAK